MQETRTPCTWVIPSTLWKRSSPCNVSQEPIIPISPWWHHFFSCHWNILAFWTSQNSCWWPPALFWAYSLAQPDHYIWCGDDLKINKWILKNNLKKMQSIFPVDLRSTSGSTVRNTFSCFCIIFSNWHEDSDQELRFRLLPTEKLERSHTDLSLGVGKAFRYISSVPHIILFSVSTHHYLPDLDTHPT